jgi:predicted O-methyltransferase YrrM
MMRTSVSASLQNAAAAAAPPKPSTAERAKTRLVHLGLRAFVRPPERLFQVPGYLHPMEGRLLYWLGGKVPPGGLALEVGSFKGKSSGFLADALPASARLACVDTWRNDAMPYDAQADVLDEFRANLRPYGERVEVHQGRSAEVARGWTRQIDVLFIDGDHSYAGATGDLQAWLPFVRPGGWLAFHDAREAPVAAAIRDHFPPGRRSGGVWAWSIFAARKKA